MHVALFSVRVTAFDAVLTPAETLLSSRRHIDLQRVNSAACPTA
ncbi:putative leader peptide [Streptomyces sp. NBC_00151]|jgi:hypothetical protein|uniref:Uncharacterized protein n=1 Tax=Streptomyces sp. NBC_01393 TaxID=2903851 RepID=A0AAU3I9X5_9ACTN|nr:putative leader peptide [Streptomyces sp. NBC_00151]WRZ37315.1 hypothetical protein OG915_04105 [Streptomyces sp. NBC_00151]